MWHPERSAARSKDVEACLRRFLRYFASDAIALTGGLAIEYHLAAAGVPPLRTKIADLDFVARDVERVSPAIAGEFLISHYHVRGPGVPKAMLQLVDPRAALRIDVFPDDAGVLDASIVATLENVELRVLSPHDVLAHKLQTLRAATTAIDPKHRRDATALAIACHVDVAIPPVVEAPERYSQDVAAVCPRCARSATPAFPLAPKEKVFSLLGYV
ncbi:MAG: hypothetical protein JO199_09680 [Candidatus Eremiobacteraeota bacterium]|nr:hypothetical protein [Candidatus Eremiobacteraeota bacterium]